MAFFQSIHVTAKRYTFRGNFWILHSWDYHNEMNSIDLSITNIWDKNEEKKLIICHYKNHSSITISFYNSTEC